MGATSASNGVPATHPSEKAVAMALMAAVMLSSCSGLGEGAAVADADCAERVVVVATSSSERSEAMRRRAVGVAAAAIESAMVCDTPVTAMAVSGGGRALLLVEEGQLASWAPPGGNARLRARRLDESTKDEILKHIAGALDSAYETVDATPSSIPALYRVAGDHASSATHLVVVTDGVHSADGVDLNRPLAMGEGARLADDLNVAQIGNASTTIVGVAQVDAGLDPPGAQWVDEVRAFNEAICVASDAETCRVLAEAVPKQVLEAPIPDQKER